MVSPAIPLSIAAALVVFSALYYLRHASHKRSALTACVIRCVMLLLVLCAFFEPVLNLRTLTPSSGNITVLVDASRSMRLFKSDSLARLVIAALKTAAADAAQTKPVVEAWAFGDSLRRLSDTRAFSFSDRQSFFPSEQDREKFGRSSAIIIISDGNWSNAAIPSSALEGINCYYLTLPGFSPRPFLRTECDSFPSSCAPDSPYIADLHIRGFKTTPDPLDIIARENGRVVGHTRLDASAGYFSDTAAIRLPSARPGRHCFTVCLIDAADSIDRRISLLGTVAPQAFMAAFHGAPSLDMRFLSLALSSSPEWKSDGSDTLRSADAMFFLDWDSHASGAFSRIKPSGVAVFIGCMPCPSQSSIAPDSMTLTASDGDDTLARAIERMTLPPPSRLIVCPHPTLTSVRSILIRRALTTEGGKRVMDSLPFLFSGATGGRDAIVLAARDIWKMEFLPLSVDRENENPSFIRQFLAIVQRRLKANVNKSFFAYPAAMELFDQDSCVFSFALPQGAQRTDGSSARPKIHFSVTRDGAPFLDTTFEAGGWTPTGIQTLKLAPFPVGDFHYSATYSSGHDRLVSADSLHVQSADAENEIQGQNTAILDQVAAPLELNKLQSAVDAAIGDAQSEKRTTGTLSLRIDQSWPLLIALLLLLGSEWMLRRKIGLDG